MDQVTHIATWKTLLTNIETVTTDNNKIDAPTLTQLATLLEHLSPQTAPRQKKDLEACTLKTHQLLGGMFETLDLSNNSLLSSFLRTLTSFGYFRIAQITYNDQGPRDELDQDPIYFPAVVKVKWYDMTPLLPEAGTIGWKGIMNHGLVKEERELMQACLKLLSQKLHFYAIILMMDQFQDFSARVQKNGEKVAEKLFELIRDVAYDDETMIGLDSSLFNLLLPFIDSDQQAAIVEAIIQDLFKPYLLQRPIRSEEIDNIYELVTSCIMIKSHLQELFFTKLIEHLKCNIIRRKRRHSMTESTLEDNTVTIESLFDNINNGEILKDLLSKLDDVELSVKSLQSGYIDYWMKVVDRVMPQRSLMGGSSKKIIDTCSILVALTSGMISHDLTLRISNVMAKSMQNTTLQFEKLFKSYNPRALIKLTKVLSEKNELLSTFDSPFQGFYKSYFGRYMRTYHLKIPKTQTGKMAKFITFICDKNLNRNASHLLQYICIHELAGYLQSPLPKCMTNKIFDVYLDSAKECSKALHKFIKRNLSLNFDPAQENGHDHDMEVSDLNLTTDTSGEQEQSGVKQAVMIDALVCILKIAIERKDQEMLDTYGDLILKLFNVITTRVENLIEITKTGTTGSTSPLDAHLFRLLELYIGHKDMIEAYLNYDLLEGISSLLIACNESPQLNGLSGESVKGNKKVVYNQIKSKLVALEERANHSMDVYPTIINKQYTSAVEQCLSSIGDIKKEKSCYHGYRQQMKILNEISAITLSNCEPNLYKRVLESTVQSLEQCDPLDHTRVLYLFLVMESLIPNQSQLTKDSPILSSFKDMLPKISCSLIRITKTVELGPSIHSFTRSGAHRSSRGIQCCTYANAIKIYNLIFLKFPPRLTNPLITDAMQICVSSNLIQYAKYRTRLHRFFIQLASAIAGLLRSICIGRKEEEHLKSSMPVFLTVFSHLIRCIILASDRRKPEVSSRIQINGHGGDNGDNNEELDNDPDAAKISKDYEAQLELLALDVGRTMNNLSFLRVKLIDYAPILISTYVKDIQRASCPDFVRVHLNEGIFRIFNLVDAHQKERREEVLDAGVQRKTNAGRASGSLFEMIHARLDQASREIFRDMHDNYNRFHRYLGRC